MGLNETQKSIIKELIEKKMDDKVATYTERDDMNKPFYFALFSKKSVYIASILHSTYTSLGYMWEKMAEIIATTNPDVVKFERQYKLEGSITAKEQEAITDYLDALEKRKKSADYEETKNIILSAYNKKDTEKPIDQTIDFFIELKSGREIYFENKTVKPNKNEMKAAKRDLMEALAMRHKEKDINLIDVALSMPYDPYFSENFERWTTIKFFQVGVDLLIGKGFWDALGGDGTYEDLLEIFSEVGDQISKQLDDFIDELEKSDFNTIKYNE